MVAEKLLAQCGHTIQVRFLPATVYGDGAMVSKVDCESSLKGPIPTVTPFMAIFNVIGSTVLYGV